MVINTTKVQLKWKRNKPKQINRKKYTKRKKNGGLWSRLVTPMGTKGPHLSRLSDPGQKGDKRVSLLSRLGGLGWKIGTKGFFQLG